MSERGAELGSARMLEWATQANRNPPLARLFDAQGHRRDEVEFHPAYHELMAYLKRHGASAGPWADPAPGAHVKRAAFYMMYAEVEDGTLCPTTMTYAVVPAIARDQALAAEWLPRIYSLEYDRRFLPAAQKKGVTLGMGMTEKQGGSDVRANTTRAWLVGEEGRGIPVILEMGTYCRLDCALGTTGLMRGALAQALHHARHRMAFGKRLAEQPLMQNVLADLALETEAATALSLRLARAFDAQADERESLLRRVLTPAAKYWICRRGPALAAEAMEVLGGNGYVEEGSLARIYRQMPLNSIWEGSGNIMCLDVLRALGRDSRCLEVLMAELDVRGDSRFERFVLNLKKDLQNASEQEARKLTQGIVLALQASLLLRHAPDYVADAFCASRLGEAAYAGGAFGALPPGTDLSALLARAWPG